MKTSTTKTLLLLGAILLLLGIATFFIRMYSNNVVYIESPAYQVLTTPEDVAQYTDLSGNPVSLLSDEPTRVLVYSWASWCPDCREQLEELNRYAATVPADVEVLAVNRMEAPWQAERFINTMPELNNLELILDPEDYLFTRIDGYAVPEIILFDESGAVLLHERGVLRLENIDAALGGENT